MLCTSPTDVAVVELESGQVTPIELSGGEDDAVRKERAKATQPGACALLDGGRTLFCTLNRRVFRFEYLGQGKYRETQRCVSSELVEEGAWGVLTRLCLCWCCASGLWVGGSKSQGRATSTP